MNTPLLLALLAACAATLYGLMAIWAALGRGHWFVRVTVVAAAIAIFVPVPAYDLAIVFLAQSLTIIVPLSLLAAAQSAARRRAYVEVTDNQPQISRHRFSLIDLFLITLTAAGIAGLAAHLPEKHRQFWPSYALIGAGMGAVSLAAAWATLGQRLAWLRWLALLAAATSVCFSIRWIQTPKEINEALFSANAFVTTPAPPAWLVPAIVCFSAAMLVLVLLIMLSAWPASFFGNRHVNSYTDATARLKRKRIAVIILLMIILLLPARVYLGLLCTLPIPPGTDGPNGYQVLTKLGADLEPGPVFDPDAASEEELRSFVMANHQRLKEARAALDLPHIVPIDYKSSEVNMEWIGAMRRLCRALGDQGSLAVRENRLDAAATHYLDDVRLGFVTARGGLVVDWLVGLAIEHFGRSQLCSISESISPETLRRLITELQKLDTSRESVNDAIRRERIWQQHAYGWPMRISFLPPVQQQAVKQAASFNIVQTRLLICDLALRLYLAEHKKFPERIEQLAPEYLPALPNDPFSEQPFVYRSDGKTFLLYSIGPDLSDNGGKPILNGVYVGDGDLLLTP